QQACASAPWTSTVADKAAQTRLPTRFPRKPSRRTARGSMRMRPIPQLSVPRRFCLRGQPSLESSFVLQGSWPHDSSGGAHASGQDDDVRKHMAEPDAPAKLFIKKRDIDRTSAVSGK